MENFQHDTKWGRKISRNKIIMNYDYVQSVLGRCIGGIVSADAVTVMIHAPPALVYLRSGGGANLPGGTHECDGAIILS